MLHSLCLVLQTLLKNIVIRRCTKIEQFLRTRVSYIHRFQTWIGNPKFRPFTLIKLLESNNFSRYVPALNSKDENNHGSYLFGTAIGKLVRWYSTILIQYVAGRLKHEKENLTEKMNILLFVSVFLQQNKTRNSSLVFVTLRPTWNY